ncbi:hypothetical protein QR680_004255 [Steinernema hermaphroditum]|uniref:RING-type domain-containing protein n=1 Tax=Steinernema hermaphroditum TaxID=289476 RepID=A0AA39LSW6_9BILA|nr:hypothetical protein QR680_004255 [Steinernema hermaphroditum]
MKAEQLPFFEPRMECFVVKGNWIYFHYGDSPHEMVVLNIVNGKKMIFRLDFAAQRYGLSLIKGELHIIYTHDDCVFAGELELNEEEQVAKLIRSKQLDRGPLSRGPGPCSSTVWDFNNKLFSFEKDKIYDNVDIRLPLFTYDNRLWYISAEEETLFLNTAPGESRREGSRIELKQLNGLSLDNIRECNMSHVIGDYAYIWCWHSQYRGPLELWKINLKEHTIENITSLIDGFEDMGEMCRGANDDNSLYVRTYDGWLWKVTLEDPHTDEVENSSVQLTYLKSIKCPVCSDPIHIPKLFPCGHTICSNCEQTLRRPDDNIIMCPQCRTHVTLKDYEALPTNWILKEYIEILKKKEAAESSLCSSCKERRELNNFFRCNECFFAGSGRTDTTDLICGGCIARKHRGHDYEEVQFAGSELRESVLSEVAAAEPLAEGYKESMHELIDELTSAAEEKLKRLDELSILTETQRQKIRENNFLTKEQLQKEADALKGIYMKAHREVDAIEEWKEHAKRVLKQ